MDLPFRFDKANRRLVDRSDCALAARWRTGDVSQLGYVSNLSPGGFCLRTRHLHSPGFASMFVIARDAEDVEVRATVAWVRQLQVESHVAAWHEMGMRLQSPIPAGYSALLDAVQNPAIERRASRRYSQSLQVTVSMAGRTLATQSVDVSQSGVFFIADAPPLLNSEVSIGLRLPGAESPLQIKGLVARRVLGDANQQVSGFAVQFVDLGEAEERTFINYLKIARELRGLTSSV